MPNSRHPDFEATDPEGRKITMASDERMVQYFTQDVYDILCREVLEYDPEEILVTDESALTDFPEDREYYVKQVMKVFRVDISDMKTLYIPDVLDRIVSSRQGKY